MCCEGTEHTLPGCQGIARTSGRFGTEDADTDALHRGETGRTDPQLLIGLTQSR